MTALDILVQSNPGMALCRTAEEVGKAFAEGKAILIEDIDSAEGQALLREIERLHGEHNEAG